MIEADALRVQRTIFISAVQRAFNTLANIVSHRFIETKTYLCAG